MFSLCFDASYGSRERTSHSRGFVILICIVRGDAWKIISYQLQLWLAGVFSFLISYPPRSFFRSTKLNEFLMESTPTLSLLEHSPMKNYNEGIGKVCLFLACGNEKFIWFRGREMRVPTVWTNRWKPTNWSRVKIFTEKLSEKILSCTPFVDHASSVVCFSLYVPQADEAELHNRSTTPERAFGISSLKALDFLIPLQLNAHKSSINFPSLSLFCDSEKFFAIIFASSIATFPIDSKALHNRVIEGFMKIKVLRRLC